MTAVENKDIIGKIHSYQSLGTLDGPGVRFVVFLQGCPLRCAYCHNPDTWDMGAAAFTATAAEVFDKAKRFKAYFGNEGGVTVSGGEALMQADFVRSLFALCRENGINTCLDTSGCIVNESVDKLLDLCDYVLLDIKMTDPEKLKRCTGADFGVVMNFLSLLEQKRIRTRIRQVIVPCFNSTEQDVLELKKLIKPYHCIERTELLAFRKLCREKYEQLKIEFPFEKYPECSPSELAKLQNLL